MLDSLKRIAGIFTASWTNRKNLEGKGFSASEAEFLPAALALQEQPMSPAPRIAMWLIVSFFTIALLWAYFGKVDITATAEGKIIGSGRSKVIQPFETATVKQINVRDGQFVKAGDVLVELDYTVAQADYQKNSTDLQFAKLEANRAQQLLANITQNASIQPLLAHRVQLRGIDKTAIAESQRLLSSQLNEYQTRLSTLDAQIQKSQAELLSVQGQVRNLEEIVPIARTRADDFKQLKDDKYASRHEYLAYQQAYLEKATELDRLRGQANELNAAVNTTKSQREQFIAETRKTTVDTLNTAQQKIDTFKQETIKAEQRQKLTVLKSPVDGTVQQLAIYTVGGVVTPAQALMVIVPKDNPVEVEAFIQNKDIGFVNEGQDAAIKIETFPHSKYGTIDGKVLTISHDAISDEKKGLIYATLVRLNSNSINVEGKQVNLSSGMAVTVEVKTGKRRVIEYFLSPLIQNTRDSLHER
jgi:hemolysin D